MKATADILSCAQEIDPRFCWPTTGWACLRRRDGVPVLILGKVIPVGCGPAQLLSCCKFLCRRRADTRLGDIRRQYRSRLALSKSFACAIDAPGIAILLKQLDPASKSDVHYARNPACDAYWFCFGVRSSRMDIPSSPCFRTGTVSSKASGSQGIGADPYGG